MTSPDHEARNSRVCTTPVNATAITAQSALDETRPASAAKSRASSPAGRMKSRADPPTQIALASKSMALAGTAHAGAIAAEWPTAPLTATAPAANARARRVRRASHHAQSARIVRPTRESSILPTVVPSAEVAQAGSNFRSGEV